MPGRLRKGRGGAPRLCSVSHTHTEPGSPVPKSVAPLSITFDSTILGYCAALTSLGVSHLIIPG